MLYFNIVLFLDCLLPYNNYYILAQTLEHNNDNIDEKRRIQKYINKIFLEYLLYHEYFKRDINISLFDLKQRHKILVKKRIRSMEPSEGKVDNIEKYDAEINKIIVEIIM